ncbi:ArsR/SmtB family transcription factor [Gelatiniphilus marinus]|uniref:ArsR/SmtB family transcription factor n=1 Tax=Gelatiniphilus marinus TaxID=1759464 RepID=A0ABW5JUR6_9FLAO
MGISKLNLHTENTNQIARISKVFAHPARVAILKYISQQDGCICNDLVDEIGLSQPTISQHLTVIGNEGLLKVIFKGKNKSYRINIERFEEFQMLVTAFFNKTKSNCC